MRNRRRVIIAIACAAVLAVGLIALIFHSPPEPVYQGKRLSVWMHDYVNWHFTAPSVLGARPPGRTNADAAVHAVGTNALPLMVRMIRSTDSPLQLKLQSLTQKLPWIQYNPILAAYQKIMAVEAFVALGPEARGAVPDLLEIYERGPDTYSKCAAADALAAIGPEARAAIPSLIRHATNQNVGLTLRVHSIRALGVMHAEPQVTVPALVDMLQINSIDVREAVLNSLVNFGADAKPALPALFELLKQKGPDQLSLNLTTVAAIQFIDPVVAHQWEAELKAATTKSP